MRPFLVGVAGPSCAGKSELAHWLKAHTGASLLTIDSYYRDAAHLPLEERARLNFDEPAALDDELLVDQVRRLAAGEAIEAPRYNFASHTRERAAARIEPGRVVVVEGLFTLYWPALRELLGLKVFVGAPEEVCLARRIERDVRERGRTVESVRRQFASSVQPMALRYVVPSARHADFRLDGLGPIESSGRLVLERVPD